MRIRFGLMTLLLIAASMMAAGQGLSQLTGTVTDATGAVVPGAKVTLENPSRGTSREETTDAKGVYHFLQIAPDTYRVRAKSQGFRESVINGVMVTVGGAATLNIKFEVGAITESVTVSGEGTLVNTSDASVGNALTSNPILQLPSFARNVAGLLTLQPGVSVFGNVNGGKTDQGNVTLDGVDVNDQMERSAFTSVLRVTLDSVQEFRTTTTNANADQGRSSGAQVQLVTRSGTNSWHGGAWWYNRYTGLAANDFFNNRASVKRPLLNINIPGARIGGPIKKDKLFFFGNWELRKDKSADNVSRLVPSVDMRNGFLSYAVAAASGGGTARLTPAQLRTLDPAGLGPNAAVMQVLNTYPLPNDTSLGDGRNIVGARFTAPRPASFKTYISKIDYNLSQNHSVFIRGQLQNDSRAGVPQFPGNQPNSVNLVNAKGVSTGLTSVFGPNIVNNLRYGLTRNSVETSGIQTGSPVTFRGLDNPVGLTLGISRQIPVHQFGDDISYTRGTHTITGGFVMRRIQNRSTNYGRSYHSAVTNISWLRGTGADVRPANIAGSDTTAFGDSVAALLGLVTSATARYNYSIDGKLLNVGQPLSRNFANEEYEIYAQDSWRFRKNLTLTYGLRWSLMPPIYEKNGVQVSTDQAFGDWFNKRGALANAGSSQAGAGLINFLALSDPKARSLYPFNKRNFAPRLAVAYSPDFDGGIMKFLFGGPGKSSIRAGWGMFYDLVGQPLARTFDATAFGFATTLTNASGQITTATTPRYTGIYNLPATLLRAAPAGGFPQLFPRTAFAITNSIDDNLQNPYTMNMNLSVSREFRGGWSLQGSYIGRQSRKSLMNRDVAMPTNLKDPASGQTYFQAATQMELLRRSNTPIANVPRIPFFENFYRNLATSNRTATQVWYEVAGFYPNDFTSALADIDMFCDPACGISPNLMLNSQFSALSTWSSIAGGNYHSMQWSLRKTLGDLTMDFNYTLAKSTDLASVEENSGSFQGFLVNSWEPSQRRGVSDFDQRHIYNSWVIWQLPFGKGKRFMSGVGRAADAVVGGWQVSGIWTQSTDLPVSVGNSRLWPTNWNITGFGSALVNTPSVASISRNSKTGGPNLFEDPVATKAQWGFTLPGQTGSRNTLRSNGRANWDFAIAKRFNMPWSEAHSVQFRWEIYNMFNQVRFGGLDISQISATNWGKFTTQVNSPRQMQLALRYEF